LKSRGQKPRIEWMKKGNLCYQGYVPKKCFSRIEGLQFTFAAKTEVAASKALNTITEGLALLECGTALQLTQWMALKEYIGSERFDILLSFPQNVFPPLYLQHGAYILSALYQEVKIQGEDEVLPGDICYFKNISSYLKKHPYGPSVGYNTVCVVANRHLGTDKKARFMGFGLAIEGASSPEIESHLFEEFNKPPLIPHDYLSKELADSIPKSATDETLSWGEFKQVQSEDHNGTKGRLVLKIRRPRLDRLEALQNTPPNKIRDLVASWSLR